MIKQAIEDLIDNATPIDDNLIVKAIKERHPGKTVGRFLECQLVLKGGYSMAGILTAFNSGPLLLVAVAKEPDGKVVLAEHYFGDSEVQCLVVGVEMPKQLVTPVNPTRPGGGSIILGQ